MRFLELFLLLVCAVPVLRATEPSTLVQRNVSENECPICLEDFDDKPIRKLACDPDRGIHHTFHAECLKEWWERDRSCPTCKRPYIDVCTPQKIIEFDSFTQFLWKLCFECP